MFLHWRWNDYVPPKRQLFFYQVLQRHAKNDDYEYIPTRTSCAVFLINAVGQRFASALKREVRQIDS